jgi:hypothetical protein
MRAIPPGLPEAVFSRIRNRFLHDMLVQQVLPLVPEEGTAIREAISGVVALLKRCLNGEAISRDEWRSAAVAARAASAADYAAAAAYAADAAPYADYYAALYADYAAGAAITGAASAAASAAFWRLAASYFFWHWAASHLLKLIGEESATWEMARKPA